MFRPFAYTLQVKRPGERHFIRVILGEDSAIIYLSILTFLPLSPLGLLLPLPALILLCLSFHAIYEIGYAENDRIGERTERQPTLNDGYDRWPLRSITTANTIFAAVTGLIGIALINVQHPFQPGMAVMIWGWITVLTVQRLTFALFNRTRPSLRPVVYPALQATRTLGILLALAFPLSPVAYVLITAQILTSSLPYVTYRCLGRRRQFPLQIIRLIMIVVGFAIVSAALHPSPIEVEILILLCLWALMKARRELTALLR